MDRKSVNIDPGTALKNGMFCFLDVEEVFGRLEPLILMTPTMVFEVFRKSGVSLPETTLDARSHRK